MVTCSRTRMTIADTIALRGRHATATVKVTEGQFALCLSAVTPRLFLAFHSIIVRTATRARIRRLPGHARRRPRARVRAPANSSAGTTRARRRHNPPDRRRRSRRRSRSATRAVDARRARKAQAASLSGCVRRAALAEHAQTPTASGARPGEHRMVGLVRAPQEAQREVK